MPRATQRTVIEPGTSWDFANGPAMIEIGPPSPGEVLEIEAEVMLGEKDVERRPDAKDPAKAERAQIPIFYLDTEDRVPWEGVFCLQYAITPRDDRWLRLLTRDPRSWEHSGDVKHRIAGIDPFERSVRMRAIWQPHNGILSLPVGKAEKRYHLPSVPANVLPTLRLQLRFGLDRPLDKGRWRMLTAGSFIAVHRCGWYQGDSDAPTEDPPRPTPPRPEPPAPPTDPPKPPAPPVDTGDDLEDRIRDWARAMIPDLISAALGGDLNLESILRGWLRRILAEYAEDLPGGLGGIVGGLLPPGYGQPPGELDADHWAEYLIGQAQRTKDAKGVLVTVLPLLISRAQGGANYFDLASRVARIEALLREKV